MCFDSKQCWNSFLIASNILLCSDLCVQKVSPFLKNITFADHGFLFWYFDDDIYVKLL